MCLVAEMGANTCRFTGLKWWVWSLKRATYGAQMGVGLKAEISGFRG